MNLIPRRIVVDGIKGWHWLGHNIFPAAVHTLQWEYTGFGCYRAKVPFGNGANYEIGPIEYPDHYHIVAIGNGMSKTYRRTLEEAMRACLKHYADNKKKG
jgi:hypothetical protein